MKDYYKILKLDRTASQDDIKASYRKLVKKYHPDANPDNPEATEIFKEVAEAYRTLSDEAKKSDYDSRMFGGASSGYDTENKAASKNKGTAYRAAENMTADDFMGASGAFESFFGFNPKNSSPELNKKDETVKPMKTSDAFRTIFGDKKF